MKIIVNNFVTNTSEYTSEYLECDYIKIDKERILFIGTRVVSVLTKNKAIAGNYRNILDYKEVIKNAFLLNQTLKIEIHKDSITIE